MIAIDLFSGVGGMSLGFQMAGVQVVAAFDHEPRHVAMHALNFPESSSHTLDLSTAKASEILAAARSGRNVDIVFGGPPCQGFSYAGRNLADDERNGHVMAFSRLCREILPRAFVMENVSGILSKRHVPLVKGFYDSMSTAGYKMHRPLILDARQFGVPQRRKRVFIVGVLDRDIVGLPETLAFQSECTAPTVADAIIDLPSLDQLGMFASGDRYSGPLGEPREYAVRMRRTREEWGMGENLTYRHGLGGCEPALHSTEVRQRFSQVVPGTLDPISRFHRLEWNGQAPTLRAGTPSGHGSHTAVRPIHPSEPRCITVRESARLQSFPDWFEFHSSKWYGYMQVGNSVPPLMAEALAKSLIQSLA